VFLGQTVNAYRDGGWDFAELLGPHGGGARHPPHPLHVPASGRGERPAVDVMAGCPAVAPQIHLPCSRDPTACSRGMARDYDARAYEALVAKLRERVPGWRSRRDVIVGFPGEDEDDFAATESPHGRVRWDSAFLFKYSPREGTRAFPLGGLVPETEKARRLERLIALQEAISAEINRTLLGAEVEVLVEGPARRPDGWMSGKSPQLKTVVFPGPPRRRPGPRARRVDDVAHAARPPGGVARRSAAVRAGCGRRERPTPRAMSRTAFIIAMRPTALSAIHESRGVRPPPST
jgi:tRNA-2-methylthio-N6-dimethylallyladenosine synthase